MENLRVYVQGNNVAVWDKIKYWDPELGNANSGAKYPLCRNFTVGLEITYKNGRSLNKNRIVTYLN